MAHLKKKKKKNILLYKTSVISIMAGHFDYKHRYLVEKNVPIALILPSRRQDGAESLGMECTSCLCQCFGSQTIFRGTCVFNDKTRQLFLLNVQKIALTKYLLKTIDNQYITLTFKFR